MTITIGWWILPLIITIPTTLYAAIIAYDDITTWDWLGGLGCIVATAVMFVPCLAWLIYFAVSYFVSF